MWRWAMLRRDRLHPIEGEGELTLLLFERAHLDPMVAVRIGHELKGLGTAGGSVDGAYQLTIRPDEPYHNIHRDLIDGPADVHVGLGPDGVPQCVTCTQRSTYGIADVEKHILGTEGAT